MHTADFDYVLPPELIAQQPATQRDQSRLLVLDRLSGSIEHRRFRDLLDYLRPGDVLVLNNSRVIPARLRGVNAKSGGQFEILLLEENSANDWWAMMKPGKRARVGTEIEIRKPKAESRNESRDIRATVVETNDEGHRRLRFSGIPDISTELDELGEVPLPPYIRRAIGAPSADSARISNSLEQADTAVGAPYALDRERYQTVYAHMAGSVAAPTAGLHFTASMLDEIRSRGVQVCFITLHVGFATFAPVKVETPSAHKMHEERYEVSEATARVVNEAKATGRRVVAVGTTTVRVMESALGVPPSGGRESGVAKPPEGGTPNRARVAAGTGRTRIFIHPPFQFQIVDVLLTNFHLPRSTLLMLVSAFASPGKTSGRETILSAYAEAIRERYRFFSYGDAMLLL
jgi:S-adenosylmethionine:tRNA ribosyltransferase-isomerase